MLEKTLYVGLDYHAKDVQVLGIDEARTVRADRRCANDWRAIVAAVDGWAGPVRAAIESGSGAAALAEELVLRAGWSVELAHPGYVARMKQSPDKTDFSDARMLADLERVGYVPRVWLAPEAIRELRRLVGHRHHVADERRRLKQRIVEPSAKRWTRAWLAWLGAEAPLSEQSRWIVRRELRLLTLVTEEIRRVEERLAQVTGDDPLVFRLRTQKGIGLVTACVLRASIGRFDRFHSGKQLSRFCGLSPRNASSGQRQATAGLIGACDRRLRATILEAAHRLKRFDPRWRALAERLKAAGKPGSVIAAAVANRWMRRLYHEMKPLGLGA